MGVWGVGKVRLVGKVGAVGRMAVRVVRAVGEVGPVGRMGFVRIVRAVGVVEVRAVGVDAGHRPRSQASRTLVQRQGQRRVTGAGCHGEQNLRGAGNYAIRVIGSVLCAGTRPGCLQGEGRGIKTALDEALQWVKEC